MKKYKVFIIQAYKEQVEDTGRLLDVVTLELINSNYTRALESAKKLVSRKHYRLANVIERYINDKS